MTVTDVKGNLPPGAFSGEEMGCIVEGFHRHWMHLIIPVVCNADLMLKNVRLQFSFSAHIILYVIVMVVSNLSGNIKTEMAVFICLMLAAKTRVIRLPIYCKL